MYVGDSREMGEGEKGVKKLLCMLCVQIQAKL